MFAYVDRTIKEQLIASGRLLCMDEQGRPCEPGATAPRPFISVVGPVPLPLHLGEVRTTFDWYAWVRDTDLEPIEAAVRRVHAEGATQLYSLLTTHMAVNSVLLHGDFRAAECPLVRVHSNCLTGDVFGSLRCDCGPQLAVALEQVFAEGVGAVIYMAGHEGRGIGLWAKAITYLLQDAGHDTYEANVRLGLPQDSRDFSDAGRLLRFFRGGDTEIRLLANNPLKREALEAMGIRVREQRPLVAGLSDHNARYLAAKRRHGHLIPEEEIDRHR